MLDIFEDSHVEFHRNDEYDLRHLKAKYESGMDVIERLFSEVSRLTTERIYQEKLLNIYDEKDKELKEEIVILRTQLEESKRVEDAKSNQLKERESRVEELEANIITLRNYLGEKDKQLKLEKSNIALDNMHKIQRYPLNIFDLGFHKEESKLYARKNNNVESKNVVERNSSNNNNKGGMKQQIQQPRRVGSPMLRGPFSLRVIDCGRSDRLQRRRKIHLII